MSEISELKQQVASLTQRLNEITVQARKIPELPEQNPLNPSSLLHVSNSGVSQSVIVQQILDAALSYRQNQLVSIGTITVAGNDITIPAGATWVINNIDYSNPADIVINVPYAADGFTRTDIIVADQLNNMYRVNGPETAGVSVQPNTPLNTVLVTVLDVTDDSINDTPPVVGDMFSLKQNFINIKDLGGIGDGVFDNTTIVNNALATYKEVYFPDGNYLVTSLVNDFGSKITGSGVILKSITGGTQQLNTGIDRYNYIFGQEYLSFVQSKQLADFAFFTEPIKVSWTGDSTTAGDATTTPYNLNNLFASLASEKGISNLTSLNNGHSGIDTEMWRTDYLSAELAENPDLYIIRYGINDPYYLKSGVAAPADSGDTYPNRRDIGDFETSLRSALTTIRDSKGQDELSILLMSPNPTSDTPNGRDEKWYEQVRKVYIQASRDFKCAFIDTYSLWLDSRGAADIYMDNPYSDGRAIHPKDIYNTWIVSKVFELVFPSALLNKISDSHFYNQSSIDRSPDFDDAPNTYKRGLSINRAESTVKDFPIDGMAFTVYGRDNAGGQFVFSRLPNNPDIGFRSINFGPGEGVSLSFSDFVKLWHSGNLPFTIISGGISTIQNLISKTLRANGRIFTTSDADYGDLLTTSGSLEISFNNATQIGNITSANFTASGYRPLEILSTTLKFTALSGTGGLIAVDASGNLSVTNVTSASGTYTPSITNGVNASSSSLVRASYSQIGNVVTVSFHVNTTPTTTSGCNVIMALPINKTSSVVTLDFGSGCANNNGVLLPVRIQSINSNSTVNIIFTANNTGPTSITGTFQYSTTE